MQEPETIGAIIDSAAARFEKAGLTYGHGTDNAHDEAAFIVLESMGVAAGEETDALKTPTPAQAKKIEALITARIETRKPAPYLLNKAYIQNIPFYVDERAIVPRSFIGELLLHEDGFNPPGFPGEINRVLDLCTGSGCLGIIAALLYENAAIDAVDISEDALEVARRNVRDHGLEDRVTLHRGDLFSPLAKKNGDRKYDLIITNPPYVDAEGMADLPPEYAAEPELALAGGADGIDLVRTIIGDAPDFLSENGGLLCEVGRGQAAVAAGFPRLPFLWLDTEASEGEVFWIPRRKMVRG